MNKKVNIIFDKTHESFAKLLKDSLIQIVEKNSDISLTISNNTTPSAYNIFIDTIDQKLIDNQNKNILINTKITTTEIEHIFPEIDFYLKNLNGVIELLNDIRSKEYWLKIYDLLTELNIDLTINKYIYLAPCSLEQNTNRDILKRQFIKEGYEVLPHNNKKQSEKQVLHDIEISEFSIHILDETFGKPNSIFEYYNDIASNYISKKYNSKDVVNQLRFIWISPELSFYDETQQLKLQQFRLDVDGLKGAEILQTPIELLKNLLKNRISLDSDGIATTTIGEKQVYIIHEENDDITAIANQLKTQNINFTKTSFGENIIKEHRRHLVNASDVIIIGDNKNNNWIKSKAKDILKSPGFGRKSPYQSVTLFTNNKSNNEQFDGVIDVISNDEKSINQFIKTLNN